MIRKWSINQAPEMSSTLKGSILIFQADMRRRLGMRSDFQRNRCRSKTTNKTQGKEEKKIGIEEKFSATAAAEVGLQRGSIIKNNFYSQRIFIVIMVCVAAAASFKSFNLSHGQVFTCVIYYRCAFFICHRIWYNTRKRCAFGFFPSKKEEKKN